MNGGKMKPKQPLSHMTHMRTLLHSFLMEIEAMMAGNKALSLLKKIMAGWSSKRNELRVRIMIFFLLHKNMDKTSLAHSFSHSLQAPVSHPHHHPKKKYNEEESQANQLMYYNKVDGSRTHTRSCAANIEEEEEEDPDLNRVFLEESEAAMEEEAPAAEEVIECQWGTEVVKEVMEVEEENVDEAADMFIKRFKRDIEPEAAVLGQPLNASTVQLLEC